MRSSLTILIVWTISILLIACQKIPSANITVDKTEYTAGDTVHLTSITSDARHWKWTLPDGTTNNEKNVDYIIDINEIDCTKDFILTVSSKNGKKKATATKSITIKQAILPSDYFAIGTGTRRYLPTSKSATASGAYWLIMAKKYLLPSSPYNYISLFVDLPGTTRPTSSSTYDLSDVVKAGVSIVEYQSDNTNSFNAISGQLNVTITNNGKVNAIFNNVAAQHIYRYENGHQDTLYTTISGNITCY